MVQRFFLPILFLGAALNACSKGSTTPQPVDPPVEQPLFDSVPTLRPLTPLLSEISGIADSKTAPQHLWGLEDSGHPPQLYLIKYDGTVVKKVFVKGAVNTDWEELCRAGSDLYIGDIGDNNNRIAEHIIYKVTEPTPAADTIEWAQKIRFQYEDGPHNAEAFFVDAETNIYIIAKGSAPSGIYKLTAPYSFTEKNTAVKVGSINLSSVVGAALAPDGNELIVKTYMRLQYYRRATGQRIEEALQNTPQPLPYKLEPQGEAVTFALDRSGYFTLSEKGLSSAVNLYFYKRN